MVEESSPPLPRAEESIEAENDTAHAQEPEGAEPAPDAASEATFVCGCEKRMRSACDGLPFYKEHERLRYCVLHYRGKEKIADFKPALASKLKREDFDFRGVWFPDEADFSGFEFSAAASFREATFIERAEFRRAIFSLSADFTHTTFSAAADFSEAAFSAIAHFSARFSADVRFRSTTFAAEAHFSYATFSAEADFSSATFNAAANFQRAAFGANASFSSATFSKNAFFKNARFSAFASFSSATFSGSALFKGTRLGDANFNLSVFHARADFSDASFTGAIRFFGSAIERPLKDTTNIAARALGRDPSLDFQHTRIEHAERIAFHSLIVRPHWFVNVDPREFVFTDVGWEWHFLRIPHEIGALNAKGVNSPNRLLAIACDQLAENAEENRRYEEASRFRYWAMDLARRTKWKRWLFWKTDWLHMLYWAVSGYGERILRALAWLIGIWIVFAILYMPVGFKTTNASSEQAATIVAEEPPRELWRALIYSFAVMSLQKPEPKPLTGTAQTLVLLETILGPVQAALLALAIRRKFMR